MYFRVLSWNQSKLSIFNHERMIIIVIEEKNEFLFNDINMKCIFFNQNNLILHDLFYEWNLIQMTLNHLYIVKHQTNETELNNDLIFLLLIKIFDFF